jgi:hypothetical protein
LTVLKTVMQIACPSTLRGSVPVAVSGPADGPSEIATRRTYARGEARVNAALGAVQVLCSVG